MPILKNSIPAMSSAIPYSLSRPLDKVCGHFYRKEVCPLTVHQSQMSPVDLMPGTLEGPGQ